MILKFTQKNVKTGNISGTVKELRSQRDKMVTFSAEGPPPGVDQKLFAQQIN